MLWVVQTVVYYVSCNPGESQQLVNTAIEPYSHVGNSNLNANF